MDDEYADVAADVRAFEDETEDARDGFTDDFKPPLRLRVAFLASFKIPRRRKTPSADRCNVLAGISIGSQETLRREAAAALIRKSRDQ